ncbi:glycerophosphodiester phosphodiesterase family protein [Microbacterium sp.]|uniref:glycerophosphodiester phosphodiesterase family protein n=1 Tax=Microbacterium sp. TaxID=51671 RepID=UPI003A88A738
MTHAWFRGAASPRILAHRGFVPPDAEGVAENSFAAVAAAHAAGADYVESDCRLTGDGVVVLAHDERLDRVLGDPRPVSTVTAAELEHLMADRGGLIRLEQALESFPTLRFNLDAKSDDVSAPMGRAIARHAERVLVSSFSDARRRVAVAAAHRSGGTPAASGGRGTVANVLLAVALRSDRLLSRVLRGIDALQIPERLRGVGLATPRLITAAHRHGVEVHVWTVNEPDEMARLLDLGVDGIVTDRCDLGLAVVASNR